MKSPKQLDQEGSVLAILLVGATIIGLGYLVRWLGVDNAHKFGLFFGVPVCIVGVLFLLFVKDDNRWWPPPGD